MLTHKGIVRQYRLEISDNYVAVFTHDDRLLASFYPYKETMLEVELRALAWIERRL